MAGRAASSGQERYPRVHHWRLGGDNDDVSRTGRPDAAHGAAARLARVFADGWRPRVRRHVRGDSGYQQPRAPRGPGIDVGKFAGSVLATALVAGIAGWLGAWIVDAVFSRF